MFPYPIATPQGCNIQTFYGTSASNSTDQFAWTKPVGVSHVYMLLIGHGGTGNATFGGGSGATTVWYGAAQHVPDNLIICVGLGNIDTLVRYSNGGVLYTLLTAQRGTGAGKGSAQAANAFAASGFYNSVAGQDGSTTSQSASSTTFLSGGGASGANVTANYGYDVSTASNRNGYFMTQPIIVGVGATGTRQGGIGCGGGLNSGLGGPGMVLIASW